MAQGSGIIVAWGCEPPAPMLGASMCPASSSSPVADHTPQLSSSRTELPVQQSVPLLVSLVGPPCSLSPCPSVLATRLVPRLVWLDTPLGSSIVVHDLYPRICSDREYLSAHHSACVNEDDLACRDFAKAKPSVDKPFVNNHPHDL